MPDENGTGTTRVPPRTLDFWRDQIAGAAASAAKRYPFDPSTQRDIIRADVLTMLLAVTDHHDDWERIAHDVAAVRQVLDGADL